MDIQKLAFIFSWLFNFTYLILFFFQIIYVFKKKSVEGISSLMFIFLFGAYLTFAYQTFLFNLPISYKILIPILLLEMLILLIQFFMFDQTRKKFFMNFFLSVGLINFALLPLVFYLPGLVGTITGWFTILFGALAQIPQILKIYKDKSSDGLSNHFMHILGVASVLEFITSMALDLPLFLKINGARVLVVYLIFYTTFRYFKK
ncbi:MAG: hypothetical protein UR14_C0005G0005 [candidate division TM6 bacterium GW2011_GWE2_31_21]|nr:MAG: hypothetical protein UR14_C0005G0005 [candidate division TM6 bacterium GW2011_GWE2_31_21]KKP53081.1 MAG: hypothetical protein UR43_C0007G0005 [candidate division TM6 bacterium GW2011_GWF2_33_332]